LSLLLAACGTEAEEPADLEDDQEAAEEPEVEETPPADEEAADVDFPTRTIDFTIPYGPGGSTDQSGRFLTDQLLQPRFGWDIVAENRPGGSTSIALTYVLESEPDGYSYGLASNSGLFMQPLVNPDVPYDGINDFEIISFFVRLPMVWFVQEDAPWETFEDLVEEARDRPGELVIGLSGAFTIPDLLLELLNNSAGLEFVSAPAAGGGGEAITQLLQGSVDAIIAGGPAALGQVEAGDFRALAVFGEDEYSLYPEATPVASLGPDFNVDLFTDYFLIAPPGIPDDTLQYLRDSHREVLQSEEWREWGEDAGFDTRYRDLDEAQQVADTYTNLFPEIVQIMEEAGR
jgi:tripartite-type tricarboxylate transporter receptor subunit TctC